MSKEPQNEGDKEVKTENVACPMVKSDVEYELPDLPEAPVFYPSAEEFADPMKYLDSIRTQAEPAGVIKIVPPKEWRCPFPIKANGDSFHFQTCVQSVDQLRHRHGPGTKFMQVLRHFHKTRGLPVPAEVHPSATPRR
jgi:histone demethylase JARID1